MGKPIDKKKDYHGSSGIGKLFGVQAKKVLKSSKWFGHAQNRNSS